MGLSLGLSHIKLNFNTITEDVNNKESTYVENEHEDSPGTNIYADLPPKGELCSSTSRTSEKVKLANLAYSPTKLLQATYGEGTA